MRRTIEWVGARLDVCGEYSLDLNLWFRIRATTQHYLSGYADKKAI
jgi:hypothetical protein